MKEEESTGKSHQRAVPGVEATWSSLSTTGAHRTGTLSAAAHVRGVDGQLTLNSNAAGRRLSTSGELLPGSNVVAGVTLTLAKTCSVAGY